MAVEHRTTVWGLEVNDSVVLYLEKGLAWAVIATVFFLATSEALKNVFYVAALALYLVVIFIRGERIVISKLGWLFIAFLGTSMLSAAVSAYPWKALTGVWGIFRYTSFFFIVERGLRNKRHMQIALWGAVGSFGFVAVVTIIHYVYRRIVEGGYYHINAMSLGGIDFAALHSVMMFALLFGMLAHVDLSGWRRNVLIAIACLSVVVLVLTTVRMLWGGLLFIMVMLGWLRSPRVARMGIAISVLLVLGLGAVDWSVREQVASLTDVAVYKRLGEGGRRAQFWVKAIRMWQDAPWLGIGPKTLTFHDDITHNPERKKYASLPLRGSAHNLYLQTAVEMGTVGLVIFVVTFGYIGVWLMQCRRIFVSSWSAAVWDGAFGSWLAILIHGLTYPSFGREHAMFFFMLLGLVHAGMRDSYVVTDGREV